MRHYPHSLLVTLFFSFMALMATNAYKKLDAAFPRLERKIAVIRFVLNACRNATRLRDLAFIGLDLNKMSTTLHKFHELPTKQQNSSLLSPFSKNKFVLLIRQKVFHVKRLFQSCPPFFFVFFFFFRFSVESCSSSVVL